MKKRFYKDIDTVTFDFLYGDSPVELIDRTSCYDIDTFEYYLKVRMRNVSGRDISEVEVRVDLYDGISVLPYKKIEYTYKIKNKKKDNTDIIGESDYILLPPSYYKSLEFIVISVTFANGEKQQLDVSSHKKLKHISEQPISIANACEIVDDNELLREKYPAVVIPEFGTSAWICSCSHKNRADFEECEHCSRNRDVLRKIYSVENLRSVDYSENHNTGTMTMRRAKTEFLDKRTPTVTDEKKEQMIEEQKIKVEKREKYKEKMRIQAIPRIALYFVLAYLLYFILNWIFGMVPQL